MKDDCCNMKVTEIKDGYRIEITGKDIKGKCKEMITNCCPDEKCCDEMPENCCPEEKE